MHQLKKDKVVCNLCGSDDADTIARGFDHEYRTTDEPFTLVRCRNCSLVYLSPRPSVSELDRIYPANYYSYNLVKNKSEKRFGDSYLRRVFQQRGLRRNARVIELLKAKKHRPLRILDVGCGDGRSLDLFRVAFGDQVETYGVEMNEEAAAVAMDSGHQIFVGRAEEVELPVHYFDLVFSFYVLEHVADPQGYMRAMTRAASPEGYVLVDTPSVDCWGARLFAGGHWGGYHIPRHWNIFSPTTMPRLATQSGLQIVHTQYFPVAIFWALTLHSLVFDRWPALADKVVSPTEMYFRGSVKNFLVFAFFTVLDYLEIFMTGKSGDMRTLMVPVNAPVELNPL